MNEYSFISLEYFNSVAELYKVRKPIMPSKDDKRSRILQAAVKVFAQLGFYNAKVSQIAKNAGIADGTIYLYFKNKDEILISFFEEEMARFIAKVSKEIESETDVKTRLRVFVKTHTFRLQHFEASLRNFGTKRRLLRASVKI